MSQKELILNVKKSFLQRTYLLSAVCLFVLTASVIFFEIPNRLDSFIFIFYILVFLFLSKLIFLHGLEYRFDQKMIFLEHKFIPWHQNALWKYLKDIKYMEIFRNVSYPKGYFHVVLYFDHNDQEEAFKIRLNNSLNHFSEALIFIDEVVKKNHINLDQKALENLKFLMEQCDENKI